MLTGEDAPPGPLRSDSRVVIVGAGQAGYVTARTLRTYGFSGEITMIGEEPHPPYERPPLSKAILVGEAPHYGSYLTTFEKLRDEGVRFIHARASELDRRARLVHVAQGGPIPYDMLLLATGGRPRRLPMQDRATDEWLCYLRDLDDVRRLRENLGEGASIVVVGGGWIGLEVAASLRKLGCRVTVVEAATRLCARALPTEPAEFLLDLHRANAVDLKLGVATRSIVLQQGRGARVELSTGEGLLADKVVVGIGMAPNVELASAAGLKVRDGVAVDAAGCTSDPRIYAAGDIAEPGSPGRRMESWSNANEQGAAAALHMLGLPVPPAPPPWFWSDQYEVNLQVLGTPEDSHTVVRLGEGRERSWLYIHGSRLTGLVAANRPRDVQIGKRIMQRGIAVDPAALAAPGFNLSTLLTGPPVSSRMN